MCIYKFTKLAAASLPSTMLPIPHQCFGVGVRLLIHDDFGHLVVTAVRSHVQRCQVVVGDVVHGHIVMQEQLDAVQMVALRGHVERRQAVLWGGEKPEWL